MRIVVDMQGAQTGSRLRGIGRYTMSLCEAIARCRGDHELVLVLNGLFADTIEGIRAAFDPLLPQENIHVWSAPGPVRYMDSGNWQRRGVAERIREACLLSLRPDIVLVSSLFEGYGDNAVTSVKCFDKETAVATILYDLMPLQNPDAHLRSPLQKEYYHQKVSSLRRADLYLAISESTRAEGMRALAIDADRIVNIAAASSPFFRNITVDPAERKSLGARFGVSRPFVMYSGGADVHKNIPRLLEAFSALPVSLREAHQLLLVGYMPLDNVEEFRRVGQQLGLGKDELLFTGYVDDQALLHLYNCCKAFVFPSLYEGFGLPPLEAMACGAPVVASRASSLPEIIGNEDALFDPTSVVSITEKLTQVLEQPSLRSQLAQRGLEQAKKFSWERTAKVALEALERHVSRTQQDGARSIVVEKTSLFRASKKKILLIKLDHMGDFVIAIPAINRLRARYPEAQLDIIVGSWNVAAAKRLNLFQNVFVFDFFKSKSADVPELQQRALTALLEKLQPYDIAIDLRRHADTRFLLSSIQADLKVGYATSEPELDRHLGIALKSYLDAQFKMTPFNNTHMSQQLMQLVDSLPADVNDYVGLPAIEQTADRTELGVALFPNAGSSGKEWAAENYVELANRLALNDLVRIINVYFGSADEASKIALKSESKVRVHVGLSFAELTQSLNGNSICIANNSFGAHIAGYLGIPVIGIYSGHDTASQWAPVFGEAYVIRRPVGCSPCYLVDRSQCQEDLRCLDIPVDVVYAKVAEALQTLSQRSSSDRGPGDLITTEHLKVKNEDVVERLVKSISDLPPLNRHELLETSIAIARGVRDASVTKQLLVDVSELAQRDAKTGVQRVVRSILKEWLINPPLGYRIEPVYATRDHEYRYARQFKAAFLEQPFRATTDDFVDFAAGDVFVGLDHQADVIPAHRTFFKELRQYGVRVVFLVHDLLAVRMPQHFRPGSADVTAKWLDVVAEADGAVCVSRSVADDLVEWVRENGPLRQRPFKVGWSHNGADIESSRPSTGIPANAGTILERIAKCPSFLMVGTIEPRKGHAQVVAAFEQLWQRDRDCNLVIVGAAGWMTEALSTKLRSHPQAGQRLFWLEGISDEFLEKLYQTCRCLICASEGEGFGLPLIEAARHRLPIIARELPVFREVAGGHAYYFSGDNAGSLAGAIENWLALKESGREPKSEGMPWLTWRESARRLSDIVLGGDWYRSVTPT